MYSPPCRPAPTQILISIESSRRDSVVICDVAVARVLLGYFEGTPVAEIPEIKISSGIIELTRAPDESEGD